jgi:glyoxylase-like metal-dependent hydrolase (beta-lactamase superfamily II)
MKIIQISVKGFDNNFSYLIIGKNKESILIDPTGELSEIEKEINKNKSKVIALLLTHSHPDHCELTKHFSKNSKIFFPKNGEVGEKELIESAGIKIELIHTPGHTKDSVVYLIENNLFSGDTIFCKGVGTTAYGGNRNGLETSLNFLATLNESITLWPGHNYGGASCTLREALNNSHIHPSEKALKKIHEMVEKYESKLSKKVFKKN